MDTEIFPAGQSVSAGVFSQLTRSNKTEITRRTPNVGCVTCAPLMRTSPAQLEHRVFGAPVGSGGADLAVAGEEPAAVGLEAFARQ